MHRMILGLAYGDPRQGDHRNTKEKLDNRRKNIRISTRSQNQMNRPKPKGFSNPFKGVTRVPGGRWAGQIHKEGKHYHLGTFETPEEAHAAYQKAADELHGEFANYGERHEHDSAGHQ